MNDLTTWRGGICWRNAILCGDGTFVRGLDAYFEEMARCGFSPDDCLVELEWVDIEPEILKGLKI